MAAGNISKAIYERKVQSLQFTAERQAEQVCLELKLDAVGTGPMTNTFCCVCAVLNRGYCSHLLGWRLLAHMVTQEITVAAK